MRRPFTPVALMLMLLAWHPAGAQTVTPPAGAQTISVGSLALKHCIKEYDGYCGSLTRPLDPAGHVPGTIDIGFEFYPHTGAGPAHGTVIAQEGGPGFSTTGSRDGYVRLLTPLRATRDILLIDKRGTGRSGAINCHALQHRMDVPAEHACAAQLGDTAWLYSSAYAADDVAAVLDALNTGPVDYYGDSYGTFFGQVFAVRHPEKLRTVVLDSAYPVLGEGPFFRSEIENGIPSFEKTCLRTPACRALGGSAAARFVQLLNSLRAAPVSGIAPGPGGTPHLVTADAGALFTVIYVAGNTPSAYRDIDAAGRAWLGQQDPVPLLRLVAEANSQEAGYIAPREFSNGLAQAVQCADYQELVDMRAPDRVRRDQYRDRLARLQQTQPDLFAPFTPLEALTAPKDPEQLNLCIAWATAPSWATPGQPVPADAKFPNVPVLVLSGEIDTVTSPKEGAWTTGLFPNATFVVIRNTGHETAIGDGGNWVPPYGGDLARCAGPIVLHFVATGGQPGDTSCALRVRPIRAVPAFAASWQDVFPATPLPGNQTDQAGLTLASAVAETVGDAVARYYVTTTTTGGGLRGGRFHLRPTPTGYDFVLDNLHWTNDLSVCGTISWNQYSDHIEAEVSFSAAGHSGTLKVTWNDRETDALAKLAGQVDGAALEAERIAP